MNTELLLSVENLSVDFGRSMGQPAVDQVSLQVVRGEVVGIVGESGSGKSTLGFAIAGLLEPNGVELSGKILFKGRNLLEINSDEFRALRGSEIGFIFQDVSSSLNPLLTIGQQLSHPLMSNGGLDKHQAIARAEELLAMVEITDPKRRLNQYPHEISGGMKQRVVIAAALSRSPSLLIADEPTTALDVTVQAQIIDLLIRLKESMSMALIFISHDLGVVARIADRVVVMKDGKIVESGIVDSVLEHPKEEYTKLLLANIPSLQYSGKNILSNFWSK
jgi:peptide/nickel transport system ATP-binding protein